MLLILLSPVSASFGGYKDDIGLTALMTELGNNMPTGSGVGVSHIEAPLNSPATSQYITDSTDSEMTGKTFTQKSGAAIASSHATSVGRNWYGITNGVAPGVTQIDAYEVNNWIGNGFLRTGNSTAAPLVETRRVQNHSWVGSTGTQSTDEEIVRRFDFAIRRDGFVAIVGLNNGNNTTVEPLLAGAYNAISVGVQNGNHSAGGTTDDVPGRIKPEIVTTSFFGDTVSYACGVVSGAATLLLKTADNSPGLVNARANSEVVKAVLLAGATKTQFPGWTRTSTQPLDLIYGAGQLNIQNSYHLLVAGEQTASSSVTVSNRGWDFATTTAGAIRYFFDVPVGFALTNCSVILTWNRAVVDSNGGAPFVMAVSVANLSLRLFSATNFTIGTQLDSSISTIQNVEHIYTNLPAGRYALEVTSDTTGTDYGLAWGGGLQAVASIVTSVNQTNWGTATPATGSYPIGSAQTFTATPSPYYIFSHWSGNLTGSINPLVLTLSSNMTVTAFFAERFTTNYPTPYWWLAAYGVTNNQELAITNIGANSFPLWQSYIAGLTPTNPSSQLRFTSQSLLQKTNLVMTWNTVTGRVYTVWSSTNSTGGFGVLPGATNLPATVQAFTNAIAPTTPPQFYRLQVQKL